MATAVFRPLNDEDGMQTRWTDGRAMKTVADSFIKPNDRLTSFERLEIYNRVYWFRVLDCLYDDYPGLRAIVGEKKFLDLATAYLAKYPSASFTLRNLGSRLEKFLREEPHWIAPNEQLALDMARFEWAQIIAFDDAALPCLTSDDVLDTPPSKLLVRLQPYLTLLELNYAVDKFLLAVKKRDGDTLRDEASNTFEAMPQAKPKRAVRKPKRERVHLAVHRYDNQLYYKRLEPEAFEILRGLADGLTVEQALAKASAARHPERSAAERNEVEGSRGVTSRSPNEESRSSRSGKFSVAPRNDGVKKIQEWFHDWSALGWICKRKNENTSR